jgi:polyisoprenyl-phosphate glycosyltransferase
MSDSNSVTQPLISIIIPVYNSAKIITYTVSEIFRVLEGQYAFEIILVEDGSPDNSGEVIKAIANNHPNVTAVSFLKNYGQHTAMFCGIKMAKGKYVVTMDDDMQNPPSELPKMIAKIEEGYDLVFAKFHKKQHEGYRNLGSKLINGVNLRLFKVPPQITISNFRIFTAAVAKRVSEMNTTFPYIPGMLLMSAATIGNVETAHLKRMEGTSNYNWSRILTLVFRLLFNFSNLPLYAMTIIGVLVSILSFVFGFALIIKGLLAGSEVKGWTSLMVVVSFFSGFIILFLGIIGEYIARVMNQMIQTQPYQIKSISKRAEGE